MLKYLLRLSHFSRSERLSVLSHLSVFHAVSMALGWLVLVPVGAWLSTVGRRRLRNWAGYHAIVMGFAGLFILAGAYCAHKASDAHSPPLTRILAPLLHMLVIKQLMVGPLIYFLRGRVGHFLPKLHRALGMVLYLGGLVHGSVGTYSYGKSVPYVYTRYLLATLGGVTALAQAYLIYNALPLWCRDMKVDTRYEPVKRRD